MFEYAEVHLLGCGALLVRILSAYAICISCYQLGISHLHRISRKVETENAFFFGFFV